MNILIVSHYFWPENLRINDLALGLVDKGHFVTVLTGIPNYPEGKFYEGYSFFKKLKENYKNIKIIRVPVIPRGKARKIDMILNYLSYPLMGSLLGPFLCKDKYDVIFVPQYSPFTVGIPAVVLKWFKKSPILFWVQDLWPESVVTAKDSIKSPFILKLIEKMVRFVYKNCVKVLIQSKAFIDNLEKMGVNQEKIYYFPNWAGEFSQQDSVSEKKEKVPDLPKGFRLMYAGNIGTIQDFETILTSMEKLKNYTDIHLIVIGEGRNSGWVREQVKLRNLDKNVHLLGRKPINEMPYYYSQADAMLVTLKTEPIFALTIPNRVQSYLASGRPIIAGLDGEGARVINEAGGGLTCPSSRPEELKDIILKLYKKTPTERTEMGSKGLDYYRKNFDYNMLMDKLVNLMANISECPIRKAY